MISIISGPTCVGKSYFIYNKKDRLSELANLSPNDIDYLGKIVKVVKDEFGRIKLDIISRSDMSKVFCLQDDTLDYQELKLSHLYGSDTIADLKISNYVIILGVPYSEYTVRYLQRRKKDKEIILDSNIEIIDLYKGWIEELNKKEIPYLLVEAIGDYKVLEEEEFFRMLND
jgi:sporulation protein YlmC with PRC-barrel domain